VGGVGAENRTLGSPPRDAGRASEYAVQMSQLDTNPYAPPATTGDARHADWYLASACRYFKGIGYLMIVYLICVIPITVYQILTDESPRMGEMIGAPMMMVAMLLFFTAMIRTAVGLPNDFPRLYRKARWLGILTGAFGFPILTIPAVIGVSRLSKYRTLVDVNGNLDPDQANKREPE
jgi:hypothetical protein